MYKFILIQQISDNLTKRMDMFKSDIDLINETLNGQLSDLKRKMMEEMNKSSGNLIKNFEESIKRLENHEKNTQTSLNGLALYKIDNETRLNELETNIHMEIKEIRKETSNHSIILENMENKINDNILNMNRDIGELMRDVNIIKVEMETMKNFKDNTVLNFKDIGDEFLKNEELYKKTSYRINLQIRDFEAKILTFEQTFNLHNENFVNIKKDIYSQIYDANLNINNKFQIFNDSLNQKLDSYDRVINDFQNQLDDHTKGIKKLLKFLSDDVDLLKSNVNNFEDLTKNLRNEFYNNINQLESFLVKKIDHYQEKKSDRFN